MRGYCLSHPLALAVGAEIGESRWRFLQCSPPQPQAPYKTGLLLGVKGEGLSLDPPWGSSTGDTSPAWSWRALLHA